MLQVKLYYLIRRRSLSFTQMIFMLTAGLQVEGVP